MQSQTPAGEAAARSTRVDVPPVGRERHHWSALSSVGCTRRERAGTGTYHSAVPAEIAELRLDLPAGLVADSDEAAAEIARFDASSEHTLGAITAVLLRSESSSSSQIEQITANARAIAEAELTGLGTGNAAGSSTTCGPWPTRSTGVTP